VHRAKKSAAFKQDIFVTVSEPEKHGEGITAYVSFKVSTRTTRETFKESEFFVRRRYNDFLWLQEVLLDSNPFNTAPPLPEKQSLQRMQRFKVSVRREVERG
jgi:hypothetical protein